VFKLPAYGHLHPSYTICAVALALDWWRATEPALPAVTIYFYEKPVYADAVKVMQGLTGAV
jgi:hypothetical protein